MFEVGKHAAADAAGMQLLTVAHALHDGRAIGGRDGVVGDLDKVGLVHAHDHHNLQCGLHSPLGMPQQSAMQGINARARRVVSTASHES
ncbi:hypothetical protein [Xanthomonas nasturtii]|uniref:hypothetical protein n=1 Tax=Xanthomonas nasturtii TaxID=1843581 RepID=UPI002013ABA3